MFQLKSLFRACVLCVFSVGMGAAETPAAVPDVAAADLYRLPEPVPAATRCADGDELLWIDTDAHVAYRRNDARFAATLHGTYSCRSLLPKKDAVANLVAATPPPISFTFRSSDVASRPACDCAARDVYYATDRERRPASGAERVGYNGERAPKGDLSFGRARVTIPLDHRMGETERPEWILFQFHEDANKHIIVHSVRETPVDVFYKNVAASALAAKGEAFVFVHGYNVGFDDAIRRTAQMKYDFGFNGPAIAYSWPSAGEIFAYAADENNAAWTTEHFRSFLQRLARTQGVTQVHVLAHSMGNRILTDALAENAERNVRLSTIKDLIFAAPDVDRDVFIQRLGTFGPTTSHMILYASNTDKAIKLSEMVHAGPRAGDADEMIALPGLESIDASAVDTSLDSHGYYAGNTSVLSDLYYVMQGRATPRFRLRAVTAEHPLFWRLAP